MKTKMRTRGMTLAIGLLVFLVTASLRVWIGTSLRSSPLLSQPILNDLGYARAADQLHDPTKGPGLTQGSPLYTRLVSLFPLGAQGVNPLLVQSCVDGLTALLVFLWVSRRWGTGAALAAALVYALDPVGAVFTARLAPVSLATLLLMLAVWLLDRDGERSSPAAGSDLACGIVLGCGTLLTPLPFVPLGLMVSRARITRRSPKGSLYRLLVPFLLIPIVVAAWNASLPGSTFALSWGSGVTLSRAFDPRSGGTPRLLAPPSWTDEIALRTEAWEALEREGTEADLLRFHATRGAQRLVENPVASLGVVLSKGASTLGAYPVPDALAPEFLLRRYARPVAFGAWSFVWILGLAAAGVMAAPQALFRSHLGVGLAAVLAAGLLGTASAAARQPAIPLLSCLAGIGLATAARLRWRPLAALVTAGIAAVGLGALAPSSRLKNPAEDLRLEAGVLSARSSPREARARLEEARAADPRNLEVHASLGQRYLHEGLLDVSRSELEGAFQADSTHVPTLMALAKLEQSVNDLPKAAELLSRAVNLRPNHPLYLNELGQVLVRSGRIDEAQALFARALSIKPDYEVARTNLEAIESYRQRLEASLYPPEMRLGENDPLSVAAPEIMASMDRADWPKADSLLTWAAALHPDHVLPHWLRAAYHARRGEMGASQRALEVCQRLAPGRPQIVQLLAGMYLESGNKAAAERLLEESITHAASDPERKKQLEAIQVALRTPAPTP